LSTLAKIGEADDGLVAGLKKFLCHELGDARGLTLSKPTRTSTGFSRENWTFVARWTDQSGDHEEPLILRRDPPGSLLDTDRRSEFEVLRALYSTGVPVPPTPWADIEGRWLGRPSLIMKIVEGECDWHVLTGSRPLATRLRLARSLLSLLADIQSVDWQDLGLESLLANPGPQAAVSELSRWNDKLHRVRLEPMPEMELILSWLRARARAARKIVLVHGDFKPGNVLILNDRISAMLDWETVHLGDPLEDLGWITNPARSGEQQIPGVWERAQIVDHYKSLTRYEFDDAELYWWNMFSCWKLAIIILTGAKAFVDGRFDRVHHNPSWLYRRMLKMMEA
jgi:aminoglycoside phosphotransferase (APT) family kinase protein